MNKTSPPEIKFKQVFGLNIAKRVSVAEKKVFNNYGEQNLA